MVKTYSLFSIILVLCVFAKLSLQTQAPLPLAVSEVMGSRHMRYHHFLWHNVRESWLSLDEETRTGLSQLGWEPPRPSLEADFTTVIHDNDSGEDFLFMHKQMVTMVNKILANYPEYPKVEGWSTFPAPNNPDFPVPPAYVIDTPGENNTLFTMMVAEMKSNAFYYNTILPTQTNLTNPDYLKTISLGYFGSRIEYEIHKYMHLRFSKKGELGFRPVPDNPTPEIDEKWDNLKYDWLGDAYSSHVNPWFWKIHGYVEDRIEDWKTANELRTIVWKGTWQGGPMDEMESILQVGAAHQATTEVPDSSDNSDSSDDSSTTNTSNLEAALELMIRSGRFSSLLREHKINHHHHHHH